MGASDSGVCCIERRAEKRDPTLSWKVQCELSDSGGISSVDFQLRERSETKAFLTENVLKCMISREHFKAEK